MYMYHVVLRIRWKRVPAYPTERLSVLQEKHGLAAEGLVASVLSFDDEQHVDHGRHRTDVSHHDRVSHRDLQVFDRREVLRRKVHHVIILILADVHVCAFRNETIPQELLLKA